MVHTVYVFTQIALTIPDHVLVVTYELMHHRYSDSWGRPGLKNVFYEAERCLIPINIMDLEIQFCIFVICMETQTSDKIT